MRDEGELLPARDEGELLPASSLQEIKGPFAFLLFLESAFKMTLG